MTAPDVTALAAALDSPPYVIDNFEAEAKRIIAALAAQGWYLAEADTTEALEQAAVRAALEGLRAEVEDIDFDDLTNLGAQMRIAALIDARLAALDA